MAEQRDLVTAEPARPFGSIEVFGHRFDDCSGKQALAAIRGRPADAHFGYVTTPNVDHIVRLGTEELADEVHAAYQNATITLCDSQVMKLLARIRGVRLTVATGSDLTAALLEAEAGSSETIVLIGGDEDTVPKLAARYRLSDLRQHVPPRGLMENSAAMDEAAAFIAANPARFVFIAVGSPQQEVIAWRAMQLAGSTGFGLCIGASIDYLTGRSRRAPRVLRHLALEWFYRLLCEPRRLWRRYLIRSPRIFRLMDGDGPND